MTIKKNRAFVFIGDLLSVKEAGPLNVINGYYLKKADLSQIEIIKQSINSLGNQHQFCKRFELRAIGGDNRGYTFEPLEPTEWNYWIIEHKHLQADTNFYIALTLSEVDLHPLFEIVFKTKHSGPSKLYNLVAYNNFVIESSFEFGSKQITRAEISNIREVYLLIQNLERVKEKFSYIYKALIDFSYLRLISNLTSFKVVGMFSIIESLIVHNPQKGDSSITQQLMSKIALLNNRFTEKIDYRDYFKGPDTLTLQKVVEKLYSYRSDIAHGDFSDFSKDLQVITDSKQSNSFLYSLVKKIVTHSLKEPQLIHDLKLC